MRAPLPCVDGGTFTDARSTGFGGGWATGRSLVAPEMAVVLAGLDGEIDRDLRRRHVRRRLLDVRRRRRRFVLFVGQLFDDLRFDRSQDRLHHLGAEAGRQHPEEQDMDDDDEDERERTLAVLGRVVDGITVSHFPSTLWALHRPPPVLRPWSRDRRHYKT